MVEVKMVNGEGKSDVRFFVASRLDTIYMIDHAFIKALY
jgi:hypothetical protein